MARFPVFQLCLSLVLILEQVLAGPFMVPSEDDDEIQNYNDQVARMLYYPRKRSCVKRGSSCDNHPSECCQNSSCRCNLWGTNCRCQRVGLFQKWG